MAGFIARRAARRATPSRAARVALAWNPGLAVVVCALAAKPTFAEPLTFDASVFLTETYTNNINYTPDGHGGFVTSIGGNIGMHGQTEGKRLKLSGSLGLGQQINLGDAPSSTITPNINVVAKLEAIDNFAFVDAVANIAPTFQSPFGAQPPGTINATQNRYTLQTYQLSPYIKGNFPGSQVNYSVRDDGNWTVSSRFGDTAPVVPNTYANNLSASMGYSGQPLGWTVDYTRSYYDNGLSDSINLGRGATFTTQTLRLTVPYQIEPQLSVGLRAGTQKNEFPFTSGRNLIYGVQAQWAPSERTQVSGFWEHQFFGAAYSLQVNHRLPNASFSLSLSRGTNSFPTTALSIPAGGAVAPYVDAAFQTRIPDPAERALAVQQFLARSGLPPTTGVPVSFYSASLDLQQSAIASLVLIGVRNSMTFSVFNLQTRALTDFGELLPTQLDFGQNNTQVGGNVAYSHIIFGRTNFGANATYSRNKGDGFQGSFVAQHSNNKSVGVNLSTDIATRTTASAFATYIKSDFSGNSQSTANNISAVNIGLTITHTF